MQLHHHKSVTTTREAMELVGLLASDMFAHGTHVLLIGPPSSARTMIARRVVDRLPPLEGDALDRAIEIQRAAGLLRDESDSVRQPFRAPHHTVSDAGLTGSAFGGRVRPGEASLATDGVLFLDQLPEFRVRAIDRLGQCLRVGEKAFVTDHCAKLVYPASPRLIISSAAPCPCGYAGAASSSWRCSCAADADRFRARLREAAENIGPPIVAWVDVSSVERKKLRLLGRMR